MIIRPYCNNNEYRKYGNEMKLLEDFIAFFFNKYNLSNTCRVLSSMITDLLPN